MGHVIGCLIWQHDQRLIVLAALLCFFACGAAVSMIARARAAIGRMQLFWLVAGGAVAGCGIWGTHFIAMLAFKSGLPVGYDPSLTLLSVVIAAVMCGAGFALAIRPKLALAGGALTGAAIGAMHYVGMAAVRAPAYAIWNYDYVAASIVVGIVMAAVAMQVAFSRNSLHSYAVGAFLFALAIFGMHFTAMSAVVYQLDPLVQASSAVLDPASLAFVVGAGALLIVALGFTGALVDNHLARRMASEAVRLRAHIRELEITKDKLEEKSIELKSALKAADAASKAKSQFLAAMSHELRTPLNAILGFAEILNREGAGPLNDRYREYIRDIADSGDHLLALINDLLDIARLDAGEVHLSEDIFTVDDVIQEACRMVAGDADAAKIILDIHPANGLPAIRADHRRIRQVLLNLIANAIKFTPADGWITLSATLENGDLVITVADTGIGIAQKDIPKALELFGQVDGKLSRQYGGVGLGLPLAKQIMELHDGWLRLTSTINVGTTVRVGLPSSRVVTGERVAA